MKGINILTKFNHVAGSGDGRDAEKEESNNLRLPELTGIYLWYPLFVICGPHLFLVDCFIYRSMWTSFWLGLSSPQYITLINQYQFYFIFFFTLPLINYVFVSYKIQSESYNFSWNFVYWYLYVFLSYL